MTRPHRRRGPGLLGLLVMNVIPILACEVANEDHCVHKAIESDAWCAAEVPGKPFCSPCAAPEHGCVAERPTAASCPRYTPDSDDATTAATTAATTTS